MSSRDKKPSKSSSNSGGIGGIRTLSDLNRPSAHDSDSDSDVPKEYYIGGEKSGMLVQDPSKHNDVDAIFDQARKVGAVQGPAENLQPSSSSSSTSFTGVGRTLTGVTIPPAAPQPPESIVHNIVFWRDGFTINDGPLRVLTDPANAPFLESILIRSEYPKELEPPDRRTAVRVNLSRRDEDYPVTFQGVGRTLGGSSAAPATSAPTGSTSLNTAPSPSMGLVVDTSLPSTSVQLRLGDGTRVVAHFNNHHTVGDIRAFIDASSPGANRAYQLQTGFPPEVLGDTTQTIEEAGLANSVIIQK